MVNSVKLTALYRVEQIMRFRNKHAIIFEQIIDPHNNLANRLHMREDICGRDDRGLAVFPFYLFRGLNIKKRLKCFDAVRIRIFGNIGRLNAENLDAFLPKTAQECTVIRADIDNEIIFIQMVFLNEGVTNQPLIVGEWLGDATSIRVSRMIDYLPIDAVIYLDTGAFLTPHHSQRIGRFWFVQHLFREQGIARWLMSKIKNEMQFR